MAAALGEMPRECNSRPRLQERRLLPARNPQRRLQRTLRQRRVAAALACDHLAVEAPQLGDEHAHLWVAHFAEQPRDERQRIWSRPTRVSVSTITTPGSKANKPMPCKGSKVGSICRSPPVRSPCIACVAPSQNEPIAP